MLSSLRQAVAAVNTVKRKMLCNEDTSDHDCLEGWGEDLLLIHMIDDATSRLLGPPCAGRLDRVKSARAPSVAATVWTIALLLR